MTAGLLDRAKNGTIPARAMPGPKLNLLIVHTPWNEDISDWLDIKRRIETRAPEIEVRIAINGSGNSVTRRWQVTRPSLVFAPCGLYDLRPRGGTIYAARRVPKLEQMERLARQGLPVPRTARLTRDIALDPVLWGRYVVAKPQFGDSGANVRLLSIRDVVARHAELTDNDAREMLIQAYIEHSQDGLPTSYRVLTMLGTALYAMRNRWAKPRAAIEEIASDGKGVIASNSDEQGREYALWNDPEIVALAERAHSAFPGFPVLGVDVLRDSDTGKLYVVEVNPGGATWHFSSPVARAKHAPEFIRQRYQQFDGLERAARVLVDRTRAEAR